MESYGTDWESGRAIRSHSKNLGVILDNFELFGTIFTYMRLFGNHLGLFEKFFVLIGSNLDPFWNHLGPLEVIFVIWDHFGVILE